MSFFCRVQTFVITAYALPSMSSRYNWYTTGKVLNINFVLFFDIFKKSAYTLQSSSFRYPNLVFFADSKRLLQYLYKAIVRYPNGYLYFTVCMSLCAYLPANVCLEVSCLCLLCVHAWFELCLLDKQQTLQTVGFHLCSKSCVRWKSLSHHWETIEQRLHSEITTFSFDRHEAIVCVSLSAMCCTPAGLPLLSPKGNNYFLCVT